MLEVKPYVLSTIVYKDTNIYNIYSFGELIGPTMSYELEYPSLTL